MRYRALDGFGNTGDVAWHISAKTVRRNDRRTAVMGGHVEACTDCGHWRAAYNSCRNLHCPRCQGGAARTWLAEREGDLLPVGYFHVVFTLPAEVADVAWQNKAAVYGLLFQAAPRR